MTEIDSRCIAFENDHTYLKTHYEPRDKILLLQNNISSVESKNYMSVLSQTSLTKNQANIACTTSKNETIQRIVNIPDSNIFFLPSSLNFSLPSNINVSQNNLLVKKVENTSSARSIQPKSTNTKMVPKTPTQSNTLLIPSTNIPSSIKLQDVTVKKSFVKPKVIVAPQEQSAIKPIKSIKNKIVKDYENGICTIKLSSNLYKRIQSGEKLFMCMECDKIYTEHKDLLDHQIFHDGCDTKITNQEKEKNEKLFVSNVKNEKVKPTKPNFKTKKRKVIFQGECIMCHSVFPDLGKHIRTVHQNNFKKNKLNHLNYHCHKCDMEFEMKQQLRAHELSTHKPIDTNTYEHCFKDLPHKEEIENYSETHDSDSMKYLCPYCDAGFSHSKGLKTHLVKHMSFNNTENSISEVQSSQVEYSPSRPPEQLDQLFEEINNISNDVDNVYIERITDDNYRVRFKNNNEDNENISSPLDPLIDEDNKIGIEFNKVSVDNHKIPLNQQQTSSVDKKRISYTVCRICMIIVSYSRIGRHMKKKHNNAAPYQCEICHAEFNRKHIMDDHRRKHTNNKPHKCIECSKCFTYKHHLNRHMMIVHNADSLEKPFKCSVCDKAFSFKEYLTLHVNSRHKGKHYMCQICGKSFSTNAALNKHQLCHTDERPFMCEHCGRTFKCKIHYETHTKNMHPGDPQMAIPAEKFECNLCNKKFSTKIYRDMHYKRHNGQGHQCDICYKIFVSKAHMQRHIKIMHRN